MNHDSTLFICSWGHKNWMIATWADFGLKILAVKISRSPILGIFDGSYPFRIMFVDKNSMKWAIIIQSSDYLIVKIMI